MWLFFKQPDNPDCIMTSHCFLVVLFNKVKRK
ncbi:hypothetical protein CY0110_18672 [Crocosphaera chwakensis CCY0110]|uniref:Uncharacterized protein n=1 Tax=Crocosphaera chwakensis CCY0110 TaxID=391612 RepID=A3IJ66_9CHRO|nr:hypothetical protein CY0110_18672 [Crocosphaera chwakensis CCY0110]